MRPKRARRKNNEASCDATTRQEDQLSPPPADSGSVAADYRQRSRQRREQLDVSGLRASSRYPAGDWPHSACAGPSQSTYSRRRGSQSTCWPPPPSSTHRPVAAQDFPAAGYKLPPPESCPFPSTSLQPHPRKPVRRYVEPPGKPGNCRPQNRRSQPSAMDYPTHVGRGRARPVRQRAPLAHPHWPASDRPPTPDPSPRKCGVGAALHRYRLLARSLLGLLSTPTEFLAARHSADAEAKAGWSR